MLDIANSWRRMVCLTPGLLNGQLHAAAVLLPLVPFWQECGQFPVVVRSCWCGEGFLPQPEIGTRPSRPYPVTSHYIQMLPFVYGSNSYKYGEECSQKHKFLLSISVFTKAAKFFAVNNSEVNSLKHLRHVYHTGWAWTLITFTLLASSALTLIIQEFV